MRTNIAVNALLTRSVDYATPSTSTIKAATAGLPVKIGRCIAEVAPIISHRKKEIRSIKDLKGKRIAIGSFGAAADLALRTVAKQDGLDPDRDLIRLQMGGSRCSLRFSDRRQRRRNDFHAAVSTCKRKKPVTKTCCGSASAGIAA